MSTAPNPLKTLMVTGYLEGSSFLALLFIAMPMKYYWSIAEPGKYIGMAHGVLFMLYLYVLMSTASKVKLPLWAMPLGTLAAILPFGPFLFDWLLKRSVQPNQPA